MDTLYNFISLDVPPLLTATFAAVSCALLGNYLVLRRLSLMGDAISHAVLPGIVMAFLLSGSRAGLPVFLGAAAAGVLTAVLVEAVRRLGGMESGAAMGVVFSIFFAAGVLLIEQAAARSVDLDADCLLHGQLESIFWFPPKELAELWSLSTLASLPGEVITSALVMAATVLFVLLFYKELALSSFDSQLATALGFNARYLHLLLMVFVAGAVVASFEAVGSILVIAMLICPAAAARLLTDRLSRQLWLSVVFALLSAVGGYFLAAYVPGWLGYEGSLNAAGMMAVTSGLLLGTAALFAPHYGVLGAQWRRAALSLQVVREDLLAELFRLEEDGAEPLREAAYLSRRRRRYARRLALRSALRRGEAVSRDGTLALTDMGKEKARSLIRAHRLWETYLVESAGLRPDHVHQRATELEHFTTSNMRQRLAETTDFKTTDPHGRDIPPPRSAPPKDLEP